MLALTRVARDRIVDSITGERFVFHQIPECGGTSVGEALRRRYALSSASLLVAPAYEAIRLQHPDISSIEQKLLVDDFCHFRLLKFLYEDIRCVVGPVRFSNIAHKQFGGKYKFVTILRDPILLMLSLFESQRAARSELLTKEHDIERYLDSDEAYHMGAIIPYFLCGLPTSANPRSSESVDSAKENLKKFTVVGFLDDMAGLERRLSEGLSVRLRIRHATESSSTPKKDGAEVSRDVRRKLERLNEANIEVYNFARTELMKLQERSA